MKKILLTAVLTVSVILAANAQPRAIGARLGWGSQEISYQHYIGNQFLEADLGTANFKSIQLYALYNWIIANPGWTSKGEWYIYGGAGIGGGYANFSSDPSYGYLGVAGQIGLEYQFDFPLALSADFRPLIGPKFGDGGGFYNKWDYMFIPSIGVRYLF